MHTKQTLSISGLLPQATELVVRMNAVSVSLLQRHFRLGYGAGTELARALESAGIVTPPTPTASVT